MNGITRFLHLARTKILPAVETLANRTAPFLHLVRTKVLATTGTLAKGIKRLFHRDLKAAHVAMLLACGAVAFAIPLLLNLAWPTLLEPLEHWAVDLRFRFRPPIAVSSDPSKEKSDNLVAIDYDDRAAREYGFGRWPWDRRVHAQVFEFLRKAGAHAVMVDLLFDHPVRDPAEDKALVDATRRAGIVIYPAVFNLVPEQQSTEAFRLAAPQHLIQAGVEGKGEISGVGDLTLPLPALTQAAAGLGHILRIPDRGGVLRRFRPVYATKGGFVTAISLTAAFRSLDVDLASVTIERGQAIRFKSRVAGEVVIPIDAQGWTWINYAGPWGTRFIHYPYSWILDQMKSAEGRAQLLARFKDKSVVLSNLTTGSGDRVATPMDHDFPTSEVHLHLLNMLLTQKFLRDTTTGEASLCLTIPILILTAAALVGGPGVIIPTYAIVLGAYLVVLQSWFNRRGMFLPAAQPILALTTGLVLLLTARLFMVSRERERFQTALGACLPPQTIQLIKESPGKIPDLLKGHARELTVYFADIQGFSAFCKRADPQLIQRVLRDFLTAMTVILRANGGTLNKYMGDGIMAFFGDAEPEGGGEEAEEERVECHAANAVRAGLEMQKKMAELNARWISQGQETHLVRIGINTGVVTVGNLGTEFLWDYTVIGPEVNKAQRLESAAEPGGLLLSRRTYALARKRGVLPDGLPSKALALKGIGEETDLYAVPPEMIAQLCERQPIPAMSGER
ncbi:MAG: adenylate/guanylate cyclase domain-containing protein [Nitrospirae bacterium]|nr:adenylate/guanylate cyclase domain-containing protein [Nitrospirota bacterium]